MTVSARNQSIQSNGLGQWRVVEPLTEQDLNNAMESDRQFEDSRRFGVDREREANYGDKGE